MKNIMISTLTHKHIINVIFKDSRDHESSPNLVLYLGDIGNLTSETVVISLCPQNKKRPLIYYTNCS